MNKENIFFRNIILNKLYSNDNISLRYGHGKFIDSMEIVHKDIFM